MIESTMSIRPNLRIEVRNAENNALLRTETVHNLIVLSGRNLVRDLLAGLSSETITHLALGTGTTPAVAANSVLQSEIFRAALTANVMDSGQMTSQYYLGKDDANGSAITEAGLFTDSSGGILFARATFAAIVKTASITVSFNWDTIIEGVAG